MDLRKFESGASGSPPTAPGTFSTGYPTAGNPATPVPATVPGAYWFHQIAEELRAVIVGAGLSPDTANLGQLWAAIQSVATFANSSEIAAGVVSTKVISPAGLASFGKSHTTNGYQKLPGGLILQWGKVTSVAMNNDATQSIVFPIAFPTSFFFGNATLRRGTTTENITAYINSESTSGFDVIMDKDNTETTSGTIYWFAIGN